MPVTWQQISSNSGMLPRGRVGAHVLALSAVIGMVVAAGALAPSTLGQVASDATGPSFAQLALPVPSRSVASGAQAARESAAAAPTVRPALDLVNLPTWIRTVQESGVWSGPDQSSTLTLLAPAGAEFKALGAVKNGRVLSYFPGDERQSAVRRWIDSRIAEAGDVPAWVTGRGTSRSPLPRAPSKVRDTDAPDVSAWYVAVVDEDSGQLLYGEKPNMRVPQASTTKIATTIVALERLPDLQQHVKATVSATEMVNRDGSSTMGLEPGDDLTVETLLNGMMLPSGNDAAEQTALLVAGARDRFVDMMNQEALALGLVDTHFANPSGMDQAGHFSSAYDMAMLGRYAMRNEEFRKLAATQRYVGDDYIMRNLNRLLGVYQGADGVKIGYTDDAHKTIVASATRNGHRVYVSLMRSEDLPGDSSRLFDWVWQTFSWD